MLLVLDVGNTNIKMGIYNGKKLEFQARLSTDRFKTEDEYAVEFYSIFRVYHVPVKEIDGVIIGSVVPQITGHLRNALRTLTGVAPVLVGPGVKTGLNIKINNPATMGADLVASGVAAAELYPCPCIIFTLGTATTISVIDGDKAFAGGCIMPGVSISLNALTAKSALLSAIGLEAPERVIGKNTEDCMKSGVVLGTAAMLDGMCQRIEEELGSRCSTVATGGLSNVIIPSCKRKIDLRDDLILEGLRIIYSRNSI